MKTWLNNLTICMGFFLLAWIYGLYWLWWVGIGLLLLSIFPNIRGLISQGWEKLGELMGRIVSPIVLFLVYYIIITPIALLSRTLSRDKLVLKKPSSTNWKHTEKHFDDLKLENLF